MSLQFWLDRRQECDCDFNLDHDLLHQLFFILFKYYSIAFLIDNF